MIWQETIDGRPATVASLTSDFAPADTKDAPILRVLFDDGGSLWLVDPAMRPVGKYNPDQPRVPAGEPGGGQFGSGEGGSSGATGGSNWRKENVGSLAQDWSVNANWEDLQHAARAVVSGVSADKYVCYDCSGDDAARYARALAIVNDINSGPTVPEPLYRGLAEPNNYKVGDTFSESLTSWTGDKVLAGRFARGIYNHGSASEPTIVSMMTGNEMKGIHLSPSIDAKEHPVHAAADEWLTSGQYRVVSVENVRWPVPGGLMGRYLKHVTVERVGNAQKADLAKYSPDQPRVPAGEPGGGQFAGGEGGGSASDMGTPSAGNYEVTSGGELKGYTPEPANSATELFNRTYNPSYTADKLVAMKGLESKVAEVESKLANAGPDTQTQFRGPDGVYTANRQAVQNALLDKTFSEEAIRAAIPKAGEQPTLYVLGGRGGSGKSWFSKSPDSPFDASKTIVINADDYKEALPEYKGWNAAVVHEESSDIAARAHEMASRAGLNVTFDATLKSSGTISRIVDQYEKAGYKIEGYFMHTAPQVSAMRALGRFEHVGRFVPPKYILASTGNEKVFDSLIPHFTRYAVYDNNTKAGPTLVYKGVRKYNPYHDEQGRFTSAGGGSDAGRLAEVEWRQPTPTEFVADRNQSIRSSYLSHLSPSDLAGSQLFVSKDGKVGVAVSPQGDIGNLFNNGGPHGAGAEAMAQAIDHGGRVLDAFDGFLVKNYARMGFVETGRMPFNRDFAPKGWDYAKQGTPDVVFMAWKGYPGGRTAAVNRAAGRGRIDIAKTATTYDSWQAGKDASYKEAVQ